MFVHPLKWRPVSSVPALSHCLLCRHAAQLLRRAANKGAGIAFECLRHRVADIAVTGGNPTVERAAGLPVVLAAASDVVTALVTAHPSAGLWVGLGVLGRTRRPHSFSGSRRHHVLS